MNNGQTTQNSSDVGISSLNTNSFQANQDIASIGETANIQNAWAPERNHQGIGGKVISSNEIAPGEGATELPQTTERLGEIIDLNPSIVQPAPQPNSDMLAPLTFNEELIRTDGDHIAKSAIKEINNAENELGQTGDIFNFYTKARDMMKKNLENSYNRKLAS